MEQPDQPVEGRVKLFSEREHMPATEKGREYALKQLKKRRANPPKHIDNASLYAGSPMYYYCRACGHTADVLPESHLSLPKKLCTECQALKDLGWLE